MAENAASVSQFGNYWEDVYQRGEQCNSAPFDEVVAFVYKQRPHDKAINLTNILEVGCGTGNNIGFLAKQGFSTYGIDISETALKIAEQRVTPHHLWRGSFTDIPFRKIFDLVIDRGALGCVPEPVMVKALSEIHRVLLSDGRLLFTPYAHPTKDTPTYYTYSQLMRILPDNMWEVISFDRNETYDVLNEKIKESHFNIVLKKR